MTKSKVVSVFLLLTIALSACQVVKTPEPTPVPPTVTPLQPATSTPIPPTATATPTATLTPTPAYPEAGYGPSDFPADVNPLTGLKVADPTLLDRRPIIVKVENLPRADRPQWGLSQADMVYEYYTELGTTRFSAIFYGKDAEQVAPIRSARLFDFNLIRGYKAEFIFGSAYEATYARLVNSEFSDRLILEGASSADVIYRFDPGGKNYLMANTAALGSYLKSVGKDNSRQNLDGVLYQMQPPASGSAADQFYVHFSAAIYNRWDYDQASGRYLRFADSQDALGGNPEAYVQLVDRANNAPIGAENVVVIFVRHNDIDARTNVEVLDVSLLGTGPAYVARDGQLYKVKWQRTSETAVLTLINEDGSPFALKPGQTWVEVMAINSSAEQKEGDWRFTFQSDW